MAKTTSSLLFRLALKRSITLEVFNRWGEVVFASNAINGGWDGKLHGVETTSRCLCVDGTGRHEQRQDDH
jgi:hypothetical protein